VRENRKCGTARCKVLDRNTGKRTKMTEIAELGTAGEDIDGMD